MTTNVEDKLSVNKYDIDRDVHITIDESLCNECKTKVALNAAVAG
jgi:ferredoxin-like protein FixX